VPTKYVEFPPIYLFLFIFLWLYFVGYVRMRIDCSNCSNFYELVYHYSASGEYVQPIALSQKAPQTSEVDMHSVLWSCNCFEGAHVQDYVLNPLILLPCHNILSIHFCTFHGFWLLGCRICEATIHEICLKRRTSVNGSKCITL